MRWLVYPGGNGHVLYLVGVGPARVGRRPASLLPVPSRAYTVYAITFLRQPRASSWAFKARRVASSDLAVRQRVTSVIAHRSSVSGHGIGSYSCTVVRSAARHVKCPRWVDSAFESQQKPCKVQSKLHLQPEQNANTHMSETRNLAGKYKHR